MGKVISQRDLTETLSISECNDGFWLYDQTRRMNLSMRAKTVESALVEALTYYQKHLQEVEACHRMLKTEVDSFVNKFSGELCD